MLEILALWQLTKQIGKIVEQKGYKSGWYKVITVVLWFGGEIIGAILGGLATSGSESSRCLIYLFALAGAAAGAVVAYIIATSVAPVDTAASPAPSEAGPASLPVSSGLRISESLRLRLFSNTIWNGLILAILIVAVLVGNISSSGMLLSPRNAQSLLWMWFIPALLVPTMALIVASGGLDLSVGAVAGLTGMIMATLIAADVSVGIALILGLGVALLVGLINGLLIGAAKLNSALVTLAMMTLLRGISQTLSDGRTLPAKTGEFLASPITLGVVLVLIIIAGIAAAELKLMLEKQAAKSNIVAWVWQSLLTGLPYVLSSIMAGFVGAFYLGRLQAATPTLGTGLEVDVLLMVFLGGTPLGGGFVNIVGAVLAALLVATTQNTSMLNKLPFFYMTVSKAAALLLFGLLCQAYYYAVNFMFVKPKKEPASQAAQAATALEPATER